MTTYVAPAIEADEQLQEEAGVPTFVAAIAVILAFFGSAWAWCYFVCRDYGGLQSCEVGWLEARAVCKG